MTLPAPLPKPKVEVLQVFESVSPQIAAATLRPCIIGPGYEVLEALLSDSSINTDALALTYSQMPLVLNQSSFPAPRGNGDELDYLEETIRLFYLDGSVLVEHERDPGDSVMGPMWMWLTAKAGLISMGHPIDVYGDPQPIAGLGGTTFKFQLDNTVRIDESADVIVNFSEGDILPEDAVEQINTAAGKTAAKLWINPENSAQHILLMSSKFGATGSVTVRDSGTANGIIGLGWDTDGAVAIEQRVEGAGLRGADDFDGDTTTPWIELFYGSYGDNRTGNYIEDTTFTVGEYPGMNDVANPTLMTPTPAWMLLLFDTPTFYTQLFEAPDTDDTDEMSRWNWVSSLPKSLPLAMDFTGYINDPGPEWMTKSGDILYTDGSVPGGAGTEVWKVEKERIKLGKINLLASTFDDDGNALTKVYDPIEVGTPLNDLPFAPKYFYVRAQGLEYASTYSINEPAVIDSPDPTDVEHQPARILADHPLPAAPINLQGLKLTISLQDFETEEWLDSFTKTVTDGPYATHIDLVTGLNTLFSGEGIEFSTVVRGVEFVTPAIASPVTFTAGQSFSITLNDIIWEYTIQAGDEGTYTADQLVVFFQGQFEDLGIDAFVDVWVDVDDQVHIWANNLQAGYALYADNIDGGIGFGAGSGSTVLVAEMPIVNDPAIMGDGYEGAKTAFRIQPPVDKPAYPILGFDLDTVPFLEGRGRDPEYNGTEVETAVIESMYAGAGPPAANIDLLSDKLFWITLTDNTGIHDFFGVVPQLDPSGPAPWGSVGDIVDYLNNTISLGFDALGVDFISAPWGGTDGSDPLIIFEEENDAILMRFNSNGQLDIHNFDDGNDLFGVAQTGPTLPTVFVTSAAYTINGTNGLDFSFYLDLRADLYNTKITGNSIYTIVEDINGLFELDSTATPIAEVIDSGTAKKLRLTSPLEGYGSFISIVDWETGTAAEAMSWDNELTEGIAYGMGRPDPDFYLSFGNVVLGAEWLRDALMGQPTASASAQAYMQYKALRLDITAMAENPALQVFEQATTLMTEMDPVTTDNPLALGMYFAKLNAPGISVTGIGIHDISSANEMGTPLGYMAAFEFLQSEDVYTLAPLTYDATVHQMLKAHINYMSEPEQMGERIGAFSAEMPTRETSEVIHSGLSANRAAGDVENSITLDANPSAALQAAGIEDIGNITCAQEVFLEIAVSTPAGSELRHYSISAVNGVIAIFRTTFSEDENEDGFYTLTPLTEEIINADWSLKIRGSSLVLASGARDLQKTAETVAQMYNSYQDRRMYFIFPDQLVANLGGPDQVIEGYYGACAMAGMVGQQAPAQPFTQFPIVGFTGVKGSNDQFTQSQLDQMAGGGAYLLIQESEGAPLVCRHQTSTDLTSIEKRELSITKTIDYTAKVLRTAVRPYIGRYNITQSLLDTLGTILQGSIGFIIESGNLNAAAIKNIVQDATQRDRILIDVELDVPYPCNYIRISLIV